MHSRTATRGWGPEQKRGAVSFTFDNLGEAADLEFGTWPTDVPVGSHYTIRDVVPKLLQKLGGMEVTFFAEAWNAETYPDTLRAMHAAGHEVGIHGWRHEIWSRLGAQEQQAVMDRSVAAMQAIGLSPCGFRPPGGAGSENLPLILRRKGMVYFSDVGDKACAVDARVARVPFQWQGVDGLFLQPELAKAAGLETGISTPSGLHGLLQTFKQALGSAKESGAHTVFVFHPWLLGQDPKRMDALMEVVESARGDNDLWIASCARVADALLTRAS